MNPARRLFLSLLLLQACFWFIQVPKAAAEYRFDSWTTDNGLPQNGVRAITQTPDGYIWFTTFDGLVRFDGVKFSVFDKSNTKGIVNNRFTSIYCDKDGTLYATTMEDGVLTVYRNGLFQTYTSDQVPGHYFETMMPDDNGELRFFAEDQNRLSRSWYYLRNGEFVFSEKKYKSDETNIHRTPSGAIWTTTPNQTIEERDGKTTIYSHHLNTYALFREDFEDSQEGLWIGGLTLTYLKDGMVKTFGEKEGFPKNSDFHSFWEESDGSIWFANGGRTAPGVGLVRYKDGRFSFFGKEVGLSGSRIFDILKDREGTIWLATNHGLNRLRKPVITSFSTQDGLIDSEVYPIFRDSKDNIWIGTVKGLSVYRNGKFEDVKLRETTRKNFEKTKWETEKISVQSFMEDSNGRIWIGANGGLSVVEDGRAERLEAAEGHHVHAILQDKSGDVWAATSRGILRFRNYENIDFYSLKEGLPNEFMTTIFQDSKGRLWFGGFGGLSEFKDEKFINYSKKDGLAGNYLRTIYEDAGGTLWLGTYDEGLSRFKDGRFSSIRQENGLFNNGVFAIEEDEKGNFWISSNRGIYRVSKQVLNDFADGKIDRINSVGYGKEDGMLSTECNGGRQPSSLRDEKGRFWFPTQNGISIVDPGAESYNPLPPPVVIESIVADGRNLDLAKPIDIHPFERNVEITFTGLSSIKSSQIRFKYKLDGFDTDWVDVGTRRIAYYTQLPPGHYKFRVISANSDGVWNESEASIEIEAWPYFYQTKLFLFLCALVIAIVILLVWRLSVYQLKRRERKLKKLVDERTRELKEANNTLQQLANSDGLTQIGNRRRFEEFLAGEWHRAIRFKTEISLVLLDIDHFKLFNDTYGHLAGDECLKQVAKALHDTIKRPTDLLARFGGEEFAIILGGTDAEGALTIAENAVENINALKIPHTRSLTGEHITVSVGVATSFAIVEMSEADLIKAADKALYRAKEGGRNRICIFNYEEELKANPEVLDEEFISIG